MSRHAVKFVSIVALIAVLVLSAACSKKAAPTAAGPGEPKAGAETSSAAMTPMIVIANKCITDSVFDKMRYVKEHGGEIHVVYQQAAFVAMAPEALVKESATWPDFSALAGGIEGFDKLALAADCKTKMAQVVATWGPMIEEMKTKGTGK